MAHFVGTNGNDRLPGRFDTNFANDIMEGLDGEDTIEGGFGNDSLLGGNDNDQLFGGALDDSLFGEQGNDTLTGGNGSNLLDGGSDNDVLIGTGSGSSVDTLKGGAGNDLLLSNGSGIVKFNGFGGGVEVDTLQGSSSSTDIFVLGNAASIFYGDPAAQAVVQNFSQGVDKVQLKGNSTLYSIAFGDRVGSALSDAAIIDISTGDVVGIFQDTTALNLSSDILFV